MNDYNNFFPLNGTPASESEIKRRKEHIKRIRVHNPYFTEILNDIRECHEYSKGSVKPNNFCFFGESGAGKTTLLETYAEKHPKEERKSYTYVPVLYVELESSSRPKDVASKILFSLGDPFFDRGTEKSMTARAHHLIEECGVELILFDEFQHLIDSDTQKVIRKAADWVKTFSNRLKVPIVLCGLLDLEKIFAANEQLDGRFPIKKLIPIYKYHEKEDRIIFKTFLKNVDDVLPFCNKSNLASSELSAKIYYSTLGNTRQIMNLLEKATELAAGHGQDSISEDYLYLAFKEIKNSKRPHIINPFHDKFNLAEYLEQEKLRERRS